MAYLSGGQVRAEGRLVAALVAIMADDLLIVHATVIRHRVLASRQIEGRVRELALLALRAETDQEVRAHHAATVPMLAVGTCKMKFRI